jgi:hypothetical protein
MWVCLSVCRSDCLDATNDGIVKGSKSIKAGAFRFFFEKNKYDTLSAFVIDLSHLCPNLVPLFPEIKPRRNAPV